MKRWRLLAWNIRAGGGARADQIIGALHDLCPDAVILSEFRDTPASQHIAKRCALPVCHTKVLLPQKYDRPATRF